MALYKFRTIIIIIIIIIKNGSLKAPQSTDHMRGYKSTKRVWSSACDMKNSDNINESIK